MHFDPIHTHKWVRVCDAALRMSDGLRGRASSAPARARREAVRAILGEGRPQDAVLPSLSASLAYWVTMQRKLRLAERLVGDAMKSVSPPNANDLEEELHHCHAEFLADAARYWAGARHEPLPNVAIDAPHGEGCGWMGALWHRTERVLRDGNRDHLSDLVNEWIRHCVRARFEQERLTLRLGLRFAHYRRKGEYERLLDAVAERREQFGWAIHAMRKLRGRVAGPWAMRADHDLEVTGFVIPPSPAVVARALGAAVAGRDVSFRMVVYNCPVYGAMRSVAAERDCAEPLSTAFCSLCEGHALLSCRLHMPRVFAVREAGMRETMGVDSPRCRFEMQGRALIGLQRSSEQAPAPVAQELERRS